MTDSSAKGAGGRHENSAPHLMRVLGIGISIIDMPHAVQTILSWAASGNAQYVCVRDVHGVMQARKAPDLIEIHERAGLVTPDGMPLVWIGRLRGVKPIGRVCGSDLVDALCKASVEHGVRHYFFGGKPGVAAEMARSLATRYPGLEIAGTFGPSFEEPSAEEDIQIVQEISAAKPHIVWVGLSTPKQEYWMRDHVARIPNAILIGVGAAFDFQTGRIKRAPVWMQRHGLEWLYRLASEPARLWYRYLVLAPQFAVLALLEHFERRRHYPST
jgi:N-acetylglucosaminyldiphosphoundecaprenol N-acetyl-beta-D-mannosaminyltransferase